MKWELYLSRQEWEEIKGAVRERATVAGESKPRCERCRQVNGKLKRSKGGYLVPHWLHTAHKHGAPMQSKNPDDYMALCDSCHMWYDRQADTSGWVPQYRQGYITTTTDQLMEVAKAAGMEIWQDGPVFCWRLGCEEGAEDTPVLAVGAALARLGRFINNAIVVR